MINLLPPDTKEIITYSRKNKKLVGWVIALFIVVVVIILMTAFGMFYIQKNVSNLKTVSETTKNRITTQKLEETQKKMETLSTNFKTVIELLKKQLLFSIILQKTGNVMPPGARLEGINLSNTDFAVDLNVAGSSRQVVTQAFVNISDPKNGLFDKADLISVSCNENPKAGELPCDAQIRVLIKNDSSFYFLNSISGASKQ